MNKNRLKHLIFFSAFILLSSCIESDNEECNFMPEITTSINKSHPCLSTGTIKITSPINADYMYKLDQGNFQTNTFFENIAAGNYRLSVKDNNGCNTSKEIIVETLAIGNKFAQVASILNARCSSCHSGFNPQAGIDFTRICDILNHWNRIQARSVEGNPSPMPPTGLISLEERNKLLEWINNGHKYEE